MRVMVLVVLLLSILLLGTLMYHKIEGWSIIDSFYFTVVTMATVGYGDIHPVTDIGKLFTTFFIFAGVGTMTYTITIVFEHAVERELLHRFSRNFRKIRVRRGPRWDFGGRSELLFKIKTLFKTLGEKIENYRNKQRTKY